MQIKNQKKKLMLRLVIVSFLVSVIMFGSAQAASYKVQKGDTLYLVGKKFGVTAQTIKNYNGLASTVIYPGQTLQIPEGANASTGTKYTVQKGDTLFLVGLRFGVSANEIIRANGLKSNIIYPGQVLYVQSRSNQPAVSSRGGYISASTISSSDLELLARAVYGESRGEPYEGQVAVAAVIINRVQSPIFPNSISGVIYQPWAFTAVNDGQINLNPNATAYKAANAALKGWDPSGGALYYYNPVKSTNSWIFNRPVIKKIGKHIFAL